MKVRIMIFLQIIFLSHIFCKIEEDLLIEYYKLKSIPRLVIFSCNRNIKLLHSLMINCVYVCDANIENLRNFRIIHGQQGFVLDADCQNFSIILQEGTKNQLFDDKYKWLILSKNNSILRTLANIPIYIDSEITIAIESIDNWNLYDVYNPSLKHGGVLKITNVGTWDKTGGFIFNKYIYLPKYLRRNHLTGVTFTGTMVVRLIHEYPGELLNYLHNNDENRAVDNFGRFYFLLFDHVRDVYNFTLNVRLDHIYGAVDANGTFNGLVGALQKKEIDFGLCPIYYKYDRIPFVDYLVPTYVMRCRFIFRNPIPIFSISGAFFKPLSNVVWLYTSCIMIIMLLLVRLAFKYEWRIERDKNNTANHTEHDWSYVALLIFGSMCQQDVSKVPNFYSSRIIIFMCVLFTFMMYQFYSGGIVSSLLSDAPVAIKTIEDLMQSHFFDQSTDPFVLQFYKQKILHKKNGSASAFYDADTGMDLVQKGNFAFQTDTSIAYAIISGKFSNEEICQLGEVQLFQTQYTHGIVSKDSPFREMLIYSFQQMVETGVVKRQRLKWTATKPECIKIVDSSTIFVGIKEFFPAILFYSVGILISILLFATEIYVHKKHMFSD